MISFPYPNYLKPTVI